MPLLKLTWCNTLERRRIALLNLLEHCMILHAIAVMHS